MAASPATPSQFARDCLVVMVLDPPLGLVPTPSQARALIVAASSLDTLEDAETAVLGRRSAFSTVQRSLGTLDQDERRLVGQRTNEVRDALRRAVASRRAALEAGRDAELLEADRIDGQAEYAARLVAEPGALPLRSLADHSPVNYLRAFI